MNSRHPSIKGISYVIARYVSDFRNEPHSQRFVYYYSLQVILGSLIKLFFIAIISFGLGIFKNAVTCIFVFSSIRLFSGGYHADTNFKCFLHTLVIIISVSFVSRLLISFYILPINITIFIFILYLTYRFAPSDTPNKPIISVIHRRNLKTKAMLLNIIWLMISVYMLNFNKHISYIPIIGISALIEALTITPWFYRIAPVVESICAKPICTLK